MTLDEEQSKGNILQMTIESINLEKEKIEERLSKEETKVGHLQDDLRAEMHKVSELIAEKNTLTTDFNYQLSRKVGK